MDKMVFLLAGLMCLATFCIHVVVWRLARPKQQILALMVIFYFIPVAFALLYWLLALQTVSPDIFWPALILYIALAGVYIQVYPAFQANCPTLFIVNFIGKHKEGVGLEEIQSIIDKVGLTKLDDRVNDLVNDDLISVRENGSINLTNKGKFLSMLFVLYRQKLLGLTEGEG
jgi:hypothetical protein